MQSYCYLCYICIIMFYVKFIIMESKLSKKELEQHTEKMIADIKWDIDYFSKKLEEAKIKLMILTGKDE